MPRTGAAGNWEEGGLKEAVVEDFWVYYVRYAAEGRVRIYGDMPEFWGSSSSLRERVCGGRYLGLRWSYWRSCFISPFFVLVSLNKKNGGI